MKHKYMKYQVRFLPALRSLLRWYEKGDNRGEVKECPLCHTANSASHVAGTTSCATCPWRVFVGSHCTTDTYTLGELEEIGIAEEPSGVVVLREQRHPGFTKWRIKNIKSWINQIEEYEKENTK